MCIVHCHNGNKKKPLFGVGISYAIKNVLPLNSGFEKIKTAVLYMWRAWFVAPFYWDTAA